MNEDGLVPLSLSQHGHSFEEKKINPNQWKQRTNSNDLKEDFEDILGLKTSIPSPDNINELIKNNFQSTSFRDTKKLLNSISNNIPIKPQHNNKNVFLSFNTKQDEPLTERVNEPPELIKNTHNVTEKIKLLNLFDPVDIIEDNDCEMPDLDDDVEMPDLDDLVHDDILDHEAEQSQSSSDIELLDTDDNKNNISMKTVLKSIANPTELGIQFAQSVLEQEEETEKEKEKEEEIPQEEKYKPDVETETKHTENGQHITINNHYYNYFNVNQPVQPQYIESKQRKLPNPWSSKSAPVQKQVYNITTYFQLALNGSIYFLTILLVAIFIKTITHDLSNLFYQQKQDHLNQISKCTEMYEINKCYLGIPKMSDACSSWQRCMLENPEKKVVNKTRIYVNLLTGVLSEFLSTIGFLNSISLCMLTYSAYFTLNLLFGYIRGKSYGKEQTHKLVERAPDVVELHEKVEQKDYQKQPLVLTY